VKIRPIRTDKDHAAALRRIESLMDAEPGTAAMDELDVLATLVEAYEDRHFPMDEPDPVEAIRFRMEQMGLTRRDLERFIGPRGRVSEVLNRQRPLSLRMIRTLHRELKIPLESLIGRDP
jgi:HTH-type transcriptional regulator / antitoxin HigA